MAVFTGSEKKLCRKPQKNVLQLCCRYSRQLSNVITWTTLLSTRQSKGHQTAEVQCFAPRANISAPPANGCGEDFLQGVETAQAPSRRGSSNATAHLCSEDKCEESHSRM